MRLMHNSRDTAYRSPTGAQPCGTDVRLRIRIEDAAPDAVHLRAWFGKESFVPMHQSEEDAALWEATLTLPEAPCLVWYDFQIWQQGQFYWYGNAEDGLGGEGALVFGGARSFQITAYDPAFSVPQWTRGAVFYQIFPDRFAQGEAGARLPLSEGRTYHADWEDTPYLMFDEETGDNVAHDFFGGTLDGIREKLPYLQDLGITALYLNPVFHAGTNHRFDTTDWRAIDPTLGDSAAFAALCDAAAARGIHIILDGVFSHSGNNNPHFTSAQAAEDSPYRDWYTFEHWPDMYKSWWGFKTLPELNKHSPAVLDYFLTGDDPVVRHWLREGADGWRIDVADELPMQYLTLLRQAARTEKADALVIGEVWEDASNKISYGQMRTYCLGDTLDGVMNYPLRDAAIAFLTGAQDSVAFKRKMDSLYENYPKPFAQALLNMLGSHDRARALNALSGADGKGLTRIQQRCLRLTDKQRALGRKRLMLMLSLIVAMPGMPCVYYGDEAGMEGCADPFNRGAFPWGHEDKALTAYFRTVLARRRQEAALTDGALCIQAPHEDVLIIRREAAGQASVTAINRGNRARKVDMGNQIVSIPAYGCESWVE